MSVRLLPYFRPLSNEISRHFVPTACFLFSMSLILPAEIYINQQMTYEFYNEEYENVAVLFATITNFDCTTDGQNEKGILNVLNEIICDFDEVLLSTSGPQKIEKIKVAGWTYMAACGLDPGRGDASVAYPNNLCASSLGRSSHLSSTGRRSYKPICKLIHFFIIFF